MVSKRCTILTGKRESRDHGWLPSVFVEVVMWYVDSLPPPPHLDGAGKPMPRLPVASAMVVNDSHDYGESIND